MLLFNIFVSVSSIISSQGLSFDKVKNHSSWNMLNNLPCGETSSDRIIGGTSAALGQFPWVVRLGYMVEGESVIEWLCGGSLITDRHVLTAAHCLTSGDMDEYKLKWVRLGEHDTRTNPDCQKQVCAPPVQDIRIKNLSGHRRFILPSFHNDIAILQLERPAEINDYVMPICLPKPEKSFNWKIGDYATVAGWGKTNVTTEERADVLQFVRVPILKHTECNTLTRNFNMSEGEICAGAQINKDACGGDSGGPLMKVYGTDEGPKTFIIGVVSFGPSLCGSIKPGVYSSVLYFLEWILDRIQRPVIM